MSMDTQHHERNMSSKRPLETPEQYSAKRPQPGPASQGDFDVDALVAQLSQQLAQQSDVQDNFDENSAALSLDNALASLTGQADPQLATNAIQAHQFPQQAVPPAEKPQISPEYRSQIEDQLRAKSSVASDDEHIAMIDARRRCLPILDSLACQVLEYLSGSHYQEVLNLVTQPESDKGRAYRHIVDIFEQTRKMYLTSKEPFLQYHPELRDSRITIQRANLATFCAAVFGTIEIGFWDLDKWFLRAFVPEHSRILKSQTSIYLELKTQAYISSMSQEKKSREEVLDELFPKDIKEQLLNSRTDRQALNNSELDFCSRCLKRRENIEEVTDQLELARTYQWIFFLRDLSDYISKHHYSLLPHPIKQYREALELKKQERQQVTTEPSAAATPAKEKSPAPVQSDNTQSPAPKSATSTPQPIDEPTKTPAKTVTPPAPARDTTEPPRKRSQPRRDLGEEAKTKAKENNGKLSESDTLAIYEAARASAEGVEVSRPSRSSVITRRSWTKEEEEALLRGLDKVQGPYWSQILELYGPGGSISEVLKDRTQVQLKDKARNLKIFFERCGYPIPAVFQYVTGNLASRKHTGKKARERKRVDEQRQAEQQSQHNQTHSAQIPAPGLRAPQVAHTLPHGTQPIAVPVGAGQDSDLQQTAEALDRALSMLKSDNNEGFNQDQHFHHLLQSVGEYMNNQ